VIRDDPGAETLLAIRNALKLGASLLFTWGIALGMRFWLPRHLGPERFGALSFADAFAATFFVALNLGVDPYVRKEVSVRPSHASDFFGGTLVLRIALSAAILGAIMLSMRAMDRPAEIRRVVYVFAAAQLFVTSNDTLSALLQAKGHVGGASVLAIATKIVWALGAVIAIARGAGLWALAFAYLVSEAIESAVLFGLARRHLGLVVRVDVRATRAVVILSLPLYLNMFAITAYNKLDMTLLAVVGTSREVGWYAAASTIAGVCLLAAPLIGWVMMPTLARAASRSHDELFSRIRRSTELILSVAIPAALLVSLGADLAVRSLFGDAFAPAGLALRILAPTFVVTYVAIVFAITLQMLERAWTLTAISLAGLVVNVLLNLAIVPPSMARFGDGGGGAGCALATLGTELFVTATMISFVGRRAFDRRTLGAVGKSLAACAIVAGVDRLAGLLGWARLVLDAAVYLFVVVATGTLRVGEIAGVLRAALRDRAHPATPALARDDG
jgi:O-antigen/teichoic acid export membrane protein